MNEGDMVKSLERFRWLVLGGLVAGALGVYAATMCWGAFPGLPAKSLAWHMWTDCGGAWSGCARPLPAGRYPPGWGR